LDNLIYAPAKGRSTCIQIIVKDMCKRKKANHHRERNKKTSGKERATERKKERKRNAKINSTNSI